MLFFSCSNNDVILNVPIQQYNKVYIHFPRNLNIQNNILVNLSYMGIRSVKRSWEVY